MGDPNLRREAVLTLEYMVKESRPDFNCIVHDSDIPFPNYLKGLEFDLIVLGPTFLCNRYYPRKLSSIKSKFNFIKDSNACKIALPQDDYDCSAILDDWMLEWEVDRIYSVCPEHWEVLYPQNFKLGRIKLGYTGYISNRWIDKWTNTKCFDSREVDISYRASKLPANFGRLGQLKSEISDLFCGAISASTTLKLDISNHEKDMIPGFGWHSFVENSKCCLVTASGSSLHDPHGLIRSKVNSFVKRYPYPSFLEIESECFPQLDNKYIFTAISPRNIEAALAETVQLATKGSYSGLLKPYDHFIPLEEDCSNVSLILEMIKDRPFISNIRRQAKEAILSEPRLRAHNFVNELICFAEDILSINGRVNISNQNQINKLIEKYYSEIRNIETVYWRRRHLKTSIRSMIYKIRGNHIFNNIFKYK
jgi:hypothetical protein